MSRFKYIPLYQGGGYIPQVFTESVAPTAPMPNPVMTQVLSQPMDSGVSTMLQVDQLQNQRDEMKLKRDQFNKQLDHDNLKILIDMVDNLDKEGDYGTTGVKGTSKNGINISGNVQTGAQFEALQKAKADKNEITNRTLNELSQLTTRGDTNAIYQAYLKAKQDINNSPMSRDAYKAVNQATTYEETAKMNRAMMEKAPGNYDPTALSAAEKEYRSSDLDYDPGKLNVENFRSLESLAGEMYKNFSQQKVRLTHAGETADGNSQYDVLMKDTKGDEVSMKEYLKRNGDNTLNYRFQDLLDRGLIDLKGRTVDQAREDYKNEEINHVVDKYANVGKSEVHQVQDNEKYKIALETEKALKLESAKAADKTQALQEKIGKVTTFNDEPFIGDPTKIKEDGVFSGYVSGNGISSESTKFTPEGFNSNLQTAKIVSDNVNKDFAENYRIKDGQYQKQTAGGEWAIITEEEFNGAKINADHRRSNYEFFEKDNQEASQYAVKKLGIDKNSIDANGNLIASKQYTEYLAGNDAQGAPYGVGAGQIYRVPTDISGKFNDAKNEFLANKYKAYQENTYKIIPADGDDYTKSVDDRLKVDPTGYLSSFSIYNKNHELLDKGVENKEIGDIKWAKLDYIEYDSLSDRWYQDIIYSNSKVKDGETPSPSDVKHVKVYDPQHSTQWTKRITGGEGTQGTIDLINDKFKHGQDYIEFGANEFASGAIKITRDPNNKAMYDAFIRGSDGLRKLNTKGSMNLLTLASNLNKLQTEYNYSPDKFIKNNGGFYNQLLAETSDLDSTIANLIGGIESNGGTNTSKNPLSSARGKFQWISDWHPKIDQFLDDELKTNSSLAAPLKGMTAAQRREYFLSPAGNALEDKFMLERAQPWYKATLNNMFSKAADIGADLVKIGDVELRPQGVQTPKEWAAWSYAAHHLGTGNVQSVINSGKISQTTIDQIKPQLKKAAWMRELFNKANGLPSGNTVFTDDQISKGKLAEVGKYLTKIMNNPVFENLTLADD